MHTTSYANVAARRLATPIWLEASAEIQAFCQAWDLSRAGRAMPRRVDINLAELAAAFAGALLAEPVPGGEQPARYRYLPIDLLIASRHDGGQAGLDPALFQHIPVRGCEVAAATGEPHLERHSLLSGDGLLLDYDIVFLPLAAAGGSEADVVEALLIFAVELPPVA